MSCIDTGPVKHEKAGKGTEFVNAIQALRTNGGGDCPELAFSGIIGALNGGAQDNSPLYIFTDATAKDEAKFDIAKATVLAKGASVYFFTTGLCGRTSYKPFEDLASESCGQMFKIPKHSSDLAKMAKITKGLLHATSCSTGTGIGPIGRKKRSASSVPTSL